MGARRHSNRASATLAAAITAGATSVTVANGKGALFPALTAGEFFTAVIQKGPLDTDAREYVRVTARAGDTMTIARGQGGTVAQAFAVNDTIAAVVTAETLDSFVQRDGDQFAGAIDWAAEVQMASADTLNVGAALSNRIEVTGSTPITSLGTGAAGLRRQLRFSNAPPPLIMHSNSLSLLGARSFRPAQGDVLEFESAGSGTWRQVNAGGSQQSAAILLWPNQGRSLLRNGGLALNSRGISSTSTTAQYFSDAWRLDTSTNGYATAAVDTATALPEGFYAASLACSTQKSGLAAGDFWSVATAVEGIDMADLRWGTANAVPATYSFWAYSYVAGTYCLTLRNGALDRYYCIPYVLPAGAWTFVSGTIPGPTSGTWYADNRIGVSFVWVGACGSSYGSATTGAWSAGNQFAVPAQVNLMASVGNKMLIAAPRFNEGPVAVPWQRPDWAAERLKALRYLWRREGLVLYRGSTDGTYGGTTLAMPLPVQMRAAPSATYGVTQDSGIHSLSVMASTDMCLIWPGSTDTAGAWCRFNIQLDADL